MPEPHCTVGEACRLARVSIGWTQREAAREIGIAQPSLNAIEHGRTLPSVRTVYRIAAAYGVTPGDLLPGR